MPLKFSFGICFLLLMGCASHKSGPPHIFYLHGLIIETQGINAVSEKFGRYEYRAILDSLAAGGAVVLSEVRTADTDFDAYCEKISRQVDSLITRGVAAEDICIIGASKGGMMAMQISHINKNPVKYVLLGANSGNTEQSFKWALHGEIIGIYETSDDIADRDYSYWIERSPDAVRFEQLELHTGLGHGFLYRPLEEWLIPARKWIQGEF
jgi:dienelactone hydrolase